MEPLYEQISASSLIQMIPYLQDTALPAVSDAWLVGRGSIQDKAGSGV